jgi:uncharacterized protein YndB with AHSA1/START domain
MTTTATARPEPETYSTTVSRVFAAPRDFVFDAFTKPELLRKWWGPEGFTLSGVEMDLRVGGAVRFDKTSGDGTEVVLTHTGFADVESADQHNRGWSSTFNCFKQTQ